MGLFASRNRLIKFVAEILVFSFLKPYKRNMLPAACNRNIKTNQEHKEPVMLK